MKKISMKLAATILCSLLLVFLSDKTILAQSCWDPGDSIQPKNATVCAGIDTSFTAVGKHSTLSYRWYKYTGSYTIIPGATSPTYKIISPTGAMNGNQYVCAIFDSCYSSTKSAADSTLSSIVTLNVHATPSITISPSSASICKGSNTMLTALNASSYIWSPSSSLTSSTSSSVTATPTVTTTYTVLGTDISGCTGKDSVTVTVNSSPTVSVTPNRPTVCRGTNVTLTAIGATSYSWSTGATTSSITVAPATSPYTIYSVTGTSNGCSSTVKDTVNVNSVTVGVSSNSTICSGSSAALSANSADTYTWSPAAGLNTTTGSSVSATPSVTTTYTVIGTSTVTGCSGKDSVTVTVNPTPTVTFAPANPAICPGFSVSITASGATNYSWSPPSGLNMTTGATVTANPSSTTTYTVNGSNGSCSSQAMITVTVGTPTVAVTPSNPSTCSGNNVTLTASGAASYSWNTGATTTSITVAPASTTTYTVTGTNVGGCNNTQTVTVTITSSPSVTVTPSSPTICLGGNTTLTANGASTYTWKPATGLSVTTGSSVTASPTVTTTYTLVGSSTGCSGPNTDTVHVTVTVNPPLTVSVTPTSASMCTGGSVALTASGATSYTWTPSNSLSTSTGSSVIATPGSTTTYTVTGSNGSCTSTATATVTVNPGTSPFMSVSPPSSSICPGGNVMLNASGSATLYTWSPSTGLNVTTGASVTASPTVATTYTVTGTNGGCSTQKTVPITIDSVYISLSPSSATICSGSSVTITESGNVSSYNWKPTTGLSFPNGNTAVASPTVTTTYTVSGAGSTCTNDSAKTTITITVNTGSTPTVTVTPANPSTCPGGTVTLTAGGASTYTWSPATDLSATTGSSVVFTAPGSGPPAYTYTVTGTNGSCPGTYTVTVMVNPKLSITVSPNSATICPGGSVTLAASGATSYTWSPSVGLNATTGATVTSTPGGTNSYTVTGVSGACNGTHTVTVTVSTPTVLTVQAFPSNTVCSGTPFQMVTSPPNGITSSTTSYTWKPIAPWMSADTGYHITAAILANTTFTVTSSSVTCPHDSGTIAITANPSPTITVTPANPTICQGSKVTLTASGGTNYTWKPSTGLSSSKGSSVNASPDSSVTYTVIDTGSNGCIGQDTTRVFVNSAKLKLGNDTTVMCGSIMQLNAVCTPPSPISIAWSPSTYLSNSTIVNPVSDPLSTVKYMVTANLSDGCTLTDSLKITLNAPTNVHICVVTVDSMSKHNIVIWDKTGLTHVDSFKVYYEDYTNHYALLHKQPFSGPGEYMDTLNDPNTKTTRYKLTAVDSCGNEEPFTSSPYHNTVYILNTAGTFQWLSGGGLYPGYQIEGYSSSPVLYYRLMRDTLSNSHWDSIAATSGSQSSITDPNYSKYQSTGSWRVDAVFSPSVISGCTYSGARVMSTNYTSSRSNQQHNSVITGTPAIPKETVSVYPNPANRILNIEFSNMQASAGNIMIMDITGRTVIEKQYEEKATSMPMDISSLPAGVYFVKVLTSSSSYILKFVKE